MLVDAEINSITAEARAFITAADAKPGRKSEARQWAAIALKCAEAAAHAQARYMALALPSMPPPAIDGEGMISGRMADALNALKTTSA